MYVESLEIKRFRCFDKAEIRLVHPHSDDAPTELPNTTVLLGDNATGKTSILMGVALSVAGNVIANTYERPTYRLVRDGSRISRLACKLRLDEWDGPLKAGPTGPAAAKTVEMRAVITARKEGTFVSHQYPDPFWDLHLGMRRDSPALFLCAYGPVRRFAEIGTALKLDQPRPVRSVGLFQDIARLVRLDDWLPPLKHESPERYEGTIAFINSLLPEEIRLLDEQRPINDHAEPLFLIDGRKVPLLGLSGGYQMYVGLVGDITYHLHRVAKSADELPQITGAILIDEVDLLLHPRWQRRVIPALSSALPKLQFILTTHSPLVAGAAFEKNIRLLRQRPDGGVQVVELQEQIHGLNAEQILLGSYFGLESTRAAGVERDLEKLSLEASKGNRRALEAFLLRLTGITHA